MTLRVVMDEVKAPIHGKEIFNLEFYVLDTHLLFVCVRGSERRCRYVDSKGMESQLRRDRNRIVSLRNTVRLYYPESPNGPETDRATPWDKRRAFSREVYPSRGKNITQRGLGVSEIPRG